MIRLDPRSPLVIDTREVGRRPGTMRRVHRTVAAPAGLGTDVIGVPEGSDIELDLRLEAVMEGVLVSGTARGRVRGECVRCLDTVDGDVEADVQELYAYPGRTPAGEDDDDVRELEDEMIDLEPVLYDTLVPALPFQPLCRDDCPGLCSECGARLADDPGHTHVSADPRWAELAKLQGQLQGPLTEHDGRNPHAVTDPKEN
ncbi:MAG: YceD family protein [Kineosporiaceae bacterium]